MGGKDIITGLVKTLPSTAGGTGSIPGQGSKTDTPHGAVRKGGTTL